MTDKMKLPNGDTIEIGGYGVTRDGRKVGPMSGNDSDMYPFRVSGRSYTGDGHYCYNEECCYDILAAWKETAAEPVLFKDMTDAEQGALVLAKHRGKAIQRFGDNGDWLRCNPAFNPDVAYRVAPPEPKIEHVRTETWFHTQKVTACYDIIDGVVDIASYRLEPRDD